MALGPRAVLIGYCRTVMLTQRHQNQASCKSLQSVITLFLLTLLFSSLLSLQKDFTRREELQQTDVESWLGFITFLCEVFSTMRSSTGEPFRVLVCPIYTCLREVHLLPHYHYHLLLLTQRIPGVHSVRLKYRTRVSFGLRNRLQDLALILGFVCSI